MFDNDEPHFTETHLGEAWLLAAVSVAAIYLATKAIYWGGIEAHYSSFILGSLVIALCMILTWRFMHWPSGLTIGSMIAVLGISSGGDNVVNAPFAFCVACWLAGFWANLLVCTFRRVKRNRGSRDIGLPDRIKHR